MLPLKVVSCDGMSNTTGPGRFKSLAYVAAAPTTCRIVAPAGLRGTLSQFAPILALLISRSVSGEVGIVPATLESIVPPTRSPAPLLKVTLDKFWLLALKP